jgi:hypothetical protein
MKIKTSELTGAALDWAVMRSQTGNADYWLEKWVDPTRRFLCESASTNWAHGGPIIERERITLSDTVTGWVAGYNGTLNSFGPTPLIAAMRCYVASKLGDEVDVPEEMT